MLRRLEIQRQMRDKWKAEAEKIAAKARQVEMEEMEALANEAKSRDAAIARRCDVYAMVPTLSGVSVRQSVQTTATSTYRSSVVQSSSGRGVTMDYAGAGAGAGYGDGSGGDVSTMGTDWEPGEDVRRTKGAGAQAVASANVRLDGGTISSLATHTNPEVRAAARRVQSMYKDS